MGVYIYSEMGIMWILGGFGSDGGLSAFFGQGFLRQYLVDLFLGTVG
jgi:hypothetical protein